MPSRQGKSAGKDRALPARILLFCGGLWLAALAVYLGRELNHDVSWYLVATERFIGGAALYRDIVEVNPPLIFYMTAPPVAAALAGGWAFAASFVVYVFALIALSLALTVPLLARASVLPPDRQGWLAAACLVALAALPADGFGQREHLAAILTLPYIALAAARFAGRGCSARLAVAVGVLAAAGFALKPHFLIVPAAIEIYLLIRRRSGLAWLRPEVVTAALGIAGYVGFVLIAHPEYAEVIVPYARLVYDDYGQTLTRVLLQPQVTVLALPAAAYIMARRSGAAGPWLDAFAIAGGGFLVAYAAQSKGWEYHLIPAMTELWICAAGALLAMRRRPPAQGWARRLLPAATPALALLALALGPLTRGGYQNEAADRLAPVLERIAPAGSFYAFTTDVWVAFPLANRSGLEWASRFPAQWLLPGARPSTDGLDAATRRRLAEIRTYAVEAVIADLLAARPHVVIIDLEAPFTGNTGLDFLELFGRDRRFAELWRDYVRIDRVATLSGTRRFDIYCRRGSTPACAG